MIKFQEQHQMSFAHVSINHFFQFSEGALRLGCTRKRGKSSRPTPAFNDATTASMIVTLSG